MMLDAKELEELDEEPGPRQPDRVRRSTAEHVNQAIDRNIDRNVRRYAGSSPIVIHRRIRELDEEWDIERVLEANASTLALTGLVLAITVNRKWVALPAAVLTFLLQHSLQGWCPPLPLLRRLGVRTRGEIDREKYALLEALDQTLSRGSRLAI